MFDTLFNPKTVAVIGASANPTKWGNWAAEQVLEHSHLRNVYLVNKLGSIIYGTQSLKAIQEIPEKIDLAIVTVPLQLFESAIDDLLTHGTTVILGITVGFGEKDQAGLEIEQRVVEKIKSAGSILIGPNCAGVLDTHAKFNCMPVLCPEKKQLPGSIGFISQSGGMITDVYLRLEEVGLNFSRAISIGNMSNIDRLVESLDNDPNTKIIAMYIEQDVPIPKTQKPFVLLSAFPTLAANMAAKKHTHSVLAQHDYICHTVRDFVARIQAIHSDQQAYGNKIVVVTDSGGLGVLASSELEKRGMQVNELSEKKQIGIRKEIGRLLPQAVIANPLDLVGIPSGFSEATIRVMRQLQHSPEVHAIVMILFLIEAQLPDEYAVGLELAASARAGGKPVVFVCKKLDSPGAKALLNSNMPVYRDVDIAVRALEYLCG